MLMSSLFPAVMPGWRLIQQRAGLYWEDLLGLYFSVYPESTGTPTIINISTSGPLTFELSEF